jgi:hypothetical protein
MGQETKADVGSMRVSDGERLEIEGVSLDVIYTPEHTDDSYSFVMQDRVFTGDTLLIRGTGRTDFQNGDPRAQYDSIFRTAPESKIDRLSMSCLVARCNMCSSVQQSAGPSPAKVTQRET